LGLIGMCKAFDEMKERRGIGASGREMVAGKRRLRADCESGKSQRDFRGIFPERGDHWLGIAVPGGPLAMLTDRCVCSRQTGVRRWDGFPMTNACKGKGTRFAGRNLRPPEGAATVIGCAKAGLPVDLSPTKLLAV